jgi:hypothetical protein
MQPTNLRENFSRQEVLEDVRTFLANTTNNTTGLTSVPRAASFEAELTDIEQCC